MRIRVAMTVPTCVDLVIEAPSVGAAQLWFNELSDCDIDDLVEGHESYLDQAGADAHIAKITKGERAGKPDLRVNSKGEEL